MTKKAEPNWLGYAVLGAFGVAFLWAIRNAVAAQATEAWVPARPIRQGITQVLWKAETDARSGEGPPREYLVESNMFVWPSGSQLAKKVWGYR